MCQTVNRVVCHKAYQIVYQPFFSGQLRVSRPPDPRYVQLTLCRQSLRDLQLWSPFTRGEGRELQPVTAYLAMHVNVADVRYGGTLGSNSGAATPGLWVAQGLLTAEELQHSINLR